MGPGAVQPAVALHKRQRWRCRVSLHFSPVLSRWRSSLPVSCYVNTPLPRTQPPLALLNRNIFFLRFLFSHYDFDLNILSKIFYSVLIFYFNFVKNENYKTCYIFLFAVITFLCINKSCWFLRLGTSKVVSIDNITDFCIFLTKVV